MKIVAWLFERPLISPVLMSKKIMDEIMIQPNEPEVNQRTLFVRFGAGRWYAILPHMEARFRKAGAEVSEMPLNCIEECLETGGPELVQASSSFPIGAQLFNLVEVIHKS